MQLTPSFEDFETAYARLIEGIGKKGDILIALSTSGNSPNILRAVESAKKKGLFTIGFSGQSGGQLADIADLMICVPSTLFGVLVAALVTCGQSSV